MTFDDICEAAGVDSYNCNSDMRAVITYMIQERPTLDHIPQKIKDEVHRWNGSLNLFEVYDSIKSKSSREISELIRYAVKYYTGDMERGFKELAFHFGVNLDEDAK